MRELEVAVVGATGLVGQEMVRVLQQRHFPLASLHLFASDRSAGKKLYFDHNEIEVQELTPKSFERIQLALFSAGAEVSRSFAPVAMKTGTIVIDNSAAYRMEPWVPLVVPEVNAADLQSHKGLVANPNCSTIEMVVALNPLHQVNPIKRIIVATYQSVSGTGAAAMEELTVQTRQILDGKSVVPHTYPHQIAFNLLPEIDVFLYDGYTKEEWKMVEETRKIMHAPEIAISATCVRVPVYISHSEALYVEFTHPMSSDDAKQILSQAPGVKVQDDPQVNLYPHPWAAAGSDDVFVGRIREDSAIPNGLAMWVVADNLRKGAALNAIQIAEELIKLGQL